MDIKYLIQLSKRNFLFWLSRKIDYPLVPPDIVQVNFTFDCNLRCKMCSMYEQKKLLQSQGKQVEIDSDTFRKIIRETKELRTETILFIGGEPLLREDLFDLVDYAKKVGLNTVIVTNGVLLGERNIHKCFDTGLDWLSISIDAATEKTFSGIRGENVLGKIIENINVLNELKDKNQKESPKMVSVCTIMDDNLEELLDTARLCKKLKIERILFQPVVANNVDQTEREEGSPGFIYPKRYHALDKAIDELIEYKKSSLENFKFIGNSIRYLQLIKRYFRGRVRPNDMPCYAGYNRVQIVQEGKLYFCVNQKEYDANFGNISRDSLKDLWYSKKARFYRKLIRHCKVPCLQWCSYRVDFIELLEIFQSRIIFGKNKQ